MKSGIVFGALGLGLLLLVMGSLWTSLFPGSSSWTPAKAERWSEVKERLHNLSFIINRPASQSAGGGTPDKAAAQEEYDRLRAEGDILVAEFKGAHETPNTTAKFLRWTGISLAAVGLVGWFAVKNS